MDQDVEAPEGVCCILDEGGRFHGFGNVSQGNDNPVSTEFGLQLLGFGGRNAPVHHNLGAGFQKVPRDFQPDPPRTAGDQCKLA
jgi:hypothetical protein